MVADGVANIRVAECYGSMWGAVAWEKEPGGRDKNNPDAAKQSRPTLGMPILIDMKKNPTADQWEGQVYNAKDGQLYKSTIKLSGPDQLEIQGCVLGFLCGGETWTRVAGPIPLSPANSMAKGGAKTAMAAAHQKRPHPRRPRPRHWPSRQDWSEDRGEHPARRSGRRHLPTPRHRGVSPLAPAETAALRRASPRTTSPAVCPCSRCPDGSTARGCRTPLPWSAR